MTLYSNTGTDIGPEKPSPINESLKNSPTRDWPLPFLSRMEAAEFIQKISCSDLEYQYFMGSYVSWHQLLPQIKCPVLLIRSKSHEAVPDSEYAKMQALITDCVAYEMTHWDHNVHLADKEQFFSCMDQFLSYVMKDLVE